MQIGERFYSWQHAMVSFLRTRNAKYVAAVIFLCICASFYFVFFRTAPNFPVNTVVTVGRGVTVFQTAQFFEDKNFVSSANLMSLLVRVLSRGHGALAGDYYFEHAQSLFQVSYRIATGDFELKKVKVTIPEGSTVKEIAKILDAAVPSFNSAAFLLAAKGAEGYLFPDTYHIPLNTPPLAIVQILRDNFDAHYATIADAVAALGKTQKDIVIMASIIEGEARLLPTKQVISGILWKRISIGMPLQVDTTFEYINGKNSLTLTLDDLKIDSPYNTYVHKGLPPTPISNPGLESLLAAATPTKTNYLYFLTDKDGVMHYATTFDQHVVNKKKYLP